MVTSIDLFYQDGHNEVMQMPVMTFIIGLLLASCSTIHKNPIGTPVESASVPKPSIESKTNEVKGTFAAWEFLSPGKIHLQYKNVDNGNNLSVIINEGVSTKSIPHGHWELTGFEQLGKSYQSMNTSKKFVFRKNAQTNAYAGSIVISCPKVSGTDLTLLKGMSFFNRYPFSSSEGLCEIIVGNNFAATKKKLLQTQKFKKLILHLGF